MSMCDLTPIIIILSLMGACSFAIFLAYKADKRESDYYKEYFDRFDRNR